MSIPQIETRRIRLGDLHPASYNPRTITEANRDGLKASMQRFGCVEDIVVNVQDGRNVIVGGHQRYEILLAENGPETTWPCKAVYLSGPDEKALNLALNNPHLQGRFSEALPEHIRQLQAELCDEMVVMDLRIRQLHEELEQVQVQEDFFDDEAVNRIIQTGQYGSITFVFTAEQLAYVKQAIADKGKPWLTDQISTLCEQEAACLDAAHR